MRCCAAPAETGEHPSCSHPCVSLFLLFVKHMLFRKDLMLFRKDHVYNLRHFSTMFLW